MRYQAKRKNRRCCLFPSQRNVKSTGVEGKVKNNAMTGENGRVKKEKSPVARQGT